MAKSEKKPIPARMTRKHRSRVEREQRQTRYVLVGTGIAVAISILVVFAGLVKTQIMDPQATRRAKESLKSVPVATVNGTMISVADWQARVRLQRQSYIRQIYQLAEQTYLVDQQISELDPADPSNELAQQMISQWRTQQQDMGDLLDAGDSIANDVLDRMVEGQLMRQEAARRSITVTPQELQEYIEVSLFNYPYPPTPEPYPTLPPPTLPPTATVTPEPTPTASPTPRSQEEFEAEYEQWLEQAREIAEMSEAAWRASVEEDLYRQALLEAFGAEIETNVQQIKGSYIFAQERETADALLARLGAGATFAALVAEIQADESEEPAAFAGNFSWSSVESIQQRVGEEFAAAAFSLTAGSYAPEPIPTADGQFYLVYVEESEVRELASYQVDQRRQELFQEWLDQAKTGDGIVYGNWRDYIPLEPSLD